jgi:catechol 2,3-dioxygenase-like lactoylglutathione lyase family enzyme
MIAGFVIGFIAAKRLPGPGAAAFWQAQGAAILAAAVAGLIVFGLSILVAPREPTIDGETLSLEFEVRMPEGRGAPDSADFSVLMTSRGKGDDRVRAQLRLDSTYTSDGRLIIPAIADINTTTRQRSLVVNDLEGKYYWFDLPLRAKPRAGDTEWIDWWPAPGESATRDINGNGGFQIRYRVRKRPPYVAPVYADDGVSAGVRLDHVPIAVADLDAATRLWRDVLGFSIKPGTHHANSIDNAHMKFADGTEIELITASKPGDALAARYLKLIANGGGPSFVALSPASLDEVADRYTKRGIAFDRGEGGYLSILDFPDGNTLDYVFFIVLKSPPVDLPEHITHANTATTLHAAWLRRGDYAAETTMLGALGASIDANAVELPDGWRADDVPLDGGHLYLIHDGAASDASWPVVGLTVEVSSLDSAVAYVRAHGVGLNAVGEDARGRFARIAPMVANGAWLEFLQR